MIAFIAGVCLGLLIGWIGDQLQNREPESRGYQPFDSDPDRNPTRLSPGGE